MQIHIGLSHLGSMIKAEKFKLPSVTFSAGVLHEVKEENNSSQEDQHIQRGKWSETLVQRHYAEASVWRMKEEGEVLSFTI